MGNYARSELFFGAVHAGEEFNDENIGKFNLQHDHPEIKVGDYVMGDLTFDASPEQYGTIIAWRESHVKQVNESDTVIQIPRFDEEEVRQKIKAFCKELGLPERDVDWHLVSSYD